uniref:Uncharacterized protein n=1 Tax=viral metagenome TaxID=1070528 RepID=A0A6M3KAH6_9ZZZZ
MDPNFVQHGLDDIAIRFLGYLVFILAYSTGVHGGVRAAFAVFRIRAADTWWDEACIAALGIFFALALDMNLFFYVAGLTNEQYVGALPVLRAHGSPAGYFNATLVIGVANVVTGAMVVGGRKAIVGMADSFVDGFNRIKGLIPKNGG